MPPESTQVTAIPVLFAALCLAGCQGERAADKPSGTTQPPATSQPKETAQMAFDKTKKTATLSTGIHMAYVEAGKPGGPVAILLHGYTDTSRSYFPTIEALVQGGTDLHIYALDQRGHGVSSMPADASCGATPEQCFAPANMAADVIAFMDLKGVQKAHLVGHSMGSVVAQEVALTSPKRIESLVLIGTWVNSTKNPGVQQFLVPLIEGTWKDALTKRQGFRWPQDAYTLTPRDADPNAEAWLAQNWVVDSVANPSFLAEIAPETASTKLGTWIGVLRNIVKFDNRERLKQLTVPALVIWATQDNFFLEEEQAAVRTALDAAVDAGKTRYVFKTYGKAPLPASGNQESDLGHNTQWGAPQAVAADITAWVRTGKPTADRPYADPSDVHKVSIDKGAAQLIEKNPAGNRARTR